MAVTVGLDVARPPMEVSLRRLAPPTLILCALSLVAPATSAAGIFGTEPIAISTGPNGQPGNGPSGGVTLSGDDRKSRLAAFHSDATNLVGGDTNDATDIFLWQRPRGGNGISLTGAGFSPLQRVSVSSSGAQANGPSRNPSLDGSIRTKPRCVAFESEASNLADRDNDRVADVFVRDLRTRRTTLVSRGIRPAATDPTIDGSCRQVAFESGGRVYLGSARGGRPRSLGRGRNPDLSLDGSAIVWEKGSAVMIRRNRRTSRVTPSGRNPSVSDNESGIWGIVFESSRRLTRRDRNSTTDVYTRVVRRGGGGTRTDLISAARRRGPSLGDPAFQGGITAYGANRGIITFGVDRGGSSSLFYRNNNSGNIDDLAHSNGEISEVYSSARANWVAFSSTGTNFRRDGNGPVQDVFIKHLIDGQRI